MKEKKINLGIQILRVIFSFHILVFHCINKKKYNYNIIKTIISDVSIDLGAFFIISFYYSYETFTSKNIIKIKQRLIRLLIPYIIWPLIIFITSNFIYLISRTKKYYINQKLLYYQLLIGNGINNVLWFQFNLIIISLLFINIIFLIQKRYLIYLGLMGIFFYIFFRSCYFDLLFPPKTFLFFSIRPIPISYIYLLSGFLLYKFRIVFLSQKYIKASISIIFVVLYYFDKYLYRKKEEFNVMKVALCIYLCMAFLNLPLSKNKNSILILTSYTGGIYNLHTTMRKIIEFLFNMKSQTLVICIINYLLCFIVCLIGSKLFRNFYLRYLFI